MPGRRSFKSDVSFLEKISMGATGTQRVFADLRHQGHDPLELERGSQGFKLWKQIKIKRIRVPDILCVSCGRRIESRAKIAPEISMSHSIADANRGWDSGLRDDDYAAIVVCQKVGSRPIDWRADELVQYVSVQAMRAAMAEERVGFVKPKGAQEGFEQRVVWPTAAASASGSVEDVSEDRISYRRAADNRLLSRQLVSKGLRMVPLVRTGDLVSQNQFLAAVVPVQPGFPCSTMTGIDYYIERLSNSLIDSERYASAKALQRFQTKDAIDALTHAVDRPDEHIYIKLEASASLARQEEVHGWQFIGDCLRDSYLEHRLEAVIVLGEVQRPNSQDLLSQVLNDKSQHAEIRAGAAWALGELRDRTALGVLIQSFNDLNDLVRVEAARALAKLAVENTSELIGELSAGVPEIRPGIAWALSQAGAFGINDVIGALVDEDARQWVAYMVGFQNPDRYLGEIERLRERDPEVYFAVTVLWKILGSWIYELEEY